jgi:iron complex outermembrane receptor protein
MSLSKHRIALGSSPTLLAVAVAMALSGGAAQAQDAAKKDQAKAETSTLEVITVTAQRREEDVQKVPISITTVEPEQIAAFGSAGDDVRMLSGRLPASTSNRPSDAPSRASTSAAWATPTSILNASQPVSLIYDEIVQENPILKGVPVYDLDRIELLRGPQGTLFGRNTPAGVVKFESKKPTQDFDAYMRANYGSYGSAVLEGAAAAASARARRPASP